MATRTKAKAAPVDEVEDDEEVELEELDDEVEDEAPAKGKAKKVPADDVWGVRNLIELIKEKTGKDYTPREVRTLLRRMARDGGRINREIIPGNKSRYAWNGPTDPEVKAILVAVKGGEIEAGKKEALDKLKADKAAKSAAKGDTPPAKGKGRKAPAPPADDDDDLEEVDDDD